MTPGTVQEYEECKGILEIYVINFLHERTGTVAVLVPQCTTCNSNLVICGGVAQMPSLRLLRFAKHSVANHSSVTY